MCLRKCIFRRRKKKKKKARDCRSDGSSISSPFHFSQPLHKLRLHYLTGMCSDPFFINGIQFWRTGISFLLPFLWRRSSSSNYVVSLWRTLAKTIGANSSMLNPSPETYILCNTAPVSATLQHLGLNCITCYKTTSCMNFFCLCLKKLIER